MSRLLCEVIEPLVLMSLEDVCFRSNGGDLALYDSGKIER